MEVNNPNGPLSEQDHSNAGSNGKDGKDSVSFETYQTLLGQRKQDQAKARELETKLKAFEDVERKRNEEKLQQEGNFKALLDAREKELQEIREQNQTLSSQVSDFEKTFTDTKKLNALFKEVGGSLKHKDYYHLVDTNKIAIDPSTGELDSKSLKAYASELVKDHKDLFNFGIGKMPGGAPVAATALSHEEWTKLAQTNPSEARKRMKDVK